MFREFVLYWDNRWEIEKVYDMVKSTEIEENLKAKILRQLKRGMT